MQLLMLYFQSDFLCASPHYKLDPHCLLAVCDHLVLHRHKHGFDIFVAQHITLQELKDNSYLFNLGSYLHTFSHHS